MKLGSWAVWWSPLIIVCSDRVYLSKLFLDIKYKKVRAHAAIVISTMAQVYGGQHSETCMLSLPGKGRAWCGLT